MTNKNNSAFPTPPNSCASGLSKREYFAALALQGIVLLFVNGGIVHSMNVAELAVKCADDLIAELNRTNE